MSSVDLTYHDVSNLLNFMNDVRVSYMSHLSSVPSRPEAVSVWIGDKRFTATRVISDDTFFHCGLCKHKVMRISARILHLKGEIEGEKYDVEFAISDLHNLKHHPKHIINSDLQRIKILTQLTNYSINASRHQQ